MSKKNNPFEKFEGKPEFTKNELPQKQNPLTQLDNLKPTSVQYKSTRIRPEEFQAIKKYAQRHDIAIVDAISLAIEQLLSMEEKNDSSADE